MGVEEQPAFLWVVCFRQTVKSIGCFGRGYPLTPDLV